MCHVKQTTLHDLFTMSDIVDAVKIWLICLVIQVLSTTIGYLERFHTGVVERQGWAAAGRERGRIMHCILVKSTGTAGIGLVY